MKTVAVDLPGESFHPQRWLGPRATTYSEERREENPGFSRAGRADPAGAPRRIPPPPQAGTLQQLLIIMLLLMAAIEANPGPRKLPQWPMWSLHPGRPSHLHPVHRLSHMDSLCLRPTGPEQSSPHLDLQGLRRASIRADRQCDEDPPL